MEREIGCSQCRYWDLKHVQQSELDEDGIVHQEYFARCLNTDCHHHDRYTEGHDSCGAFEQRV